ncbi:MAG: methyltransferase domain-containing protein [Anaerolineae bacterium]|nr:methyltransferase domain-containing protein [Anaerolineae bacterium]
MATMRVDKYHTSISGENRELLLKLQQRMRIYYSSQQYHDTWISGHNVNWTEGTHDAQIAVCQRIPAQADVLEVGCGKGEAAHEIERLVGSINYVGLDLNPSLGGRNKYVSASAEAVPFRDASFDVVASMFVIEHLVFPAEFLRESWRLLRDKGQLLIVAPDFSHKPMASERSGFSYGQGRDKLREGKVLDAFLTLVDNKIRIAQMRKYRVQQISDGQFDFPILADPRCLHLHGFVPDCDAVYPAHPQEIINYLRHIDKNVQCQFVYRDSSQFGLVATKNN